MGVSEHEPKPTCQLASTFQVSSSLQDPPPTVLLLELVEGPLAGNTLQGDASQAKKYQVGRTRTSKKFQIKDPSISEKHAEIIVRDGQWLLRDLGSSNGTMVNEQQLPEKGTHRRSAM